METERLLVAAFFWALSIYEYVMLRRAVRLRRAVKQNTCEWVSAVITEVGLGLTRKRLRPRRVIAEYTAGGKRYRGRMICSPLSFVYQGTEIRVLICSRQPEWFAENEKQSADGVLTYGVCCPLIILTAVIMTVTAL